MNRIYSLLIVIIVTSLVIRIYRVGSFIAFPESDVYYYLHCLNVFTGNGSLDCSHPGFISFMGTLGRFSGIQPISLLRYFGPVLGTLITLIVFVAGRYFFDESIGILSSFAWTVTPLVIIRGGQTIAETLVLIPFVIYLYLLYAVLKGHSSRSLLLVPIILALFFIHNLTFVVAMFLTLFLLVVRSGYNREWLFLSLIGGATVLFLAVINYVKPASMSAFKESYHLFYSAVRDYVGTHSFGSPTSLAVSVWDMVFSVIVLGTLGAFAVLKHRSRGGICIVIIAIILFMLTQAFRIDFNFLPHRFIIYLVVPLAILSGYALAYLCRNGRGCAVTVALCALLVIYAFTFPYSFNFLVNDADFESLSWGREHVEGPVTTYSKINNSQNKYEAMLDTRVVFNNELFITRDVDIALLEVVASSFSMPMGNDPPHGEQVYAASPLSDGQAIQLSGQDRTCTSLIIADIFWDAPEYVILSDALEWQQGIAWGKEFSIPVILYADEHRGDIVNFVQAWGSTVVAGLDSEKLLYALELADIPYVLAPEKKLVTGTVDGYLYFKAPDGDSFESITSPYLYLSKEASTDYHNIDTLLDASSLAKIYHMNDTAFYKKK